MAPPGSVLFVVIKLSYTTPQYIKNVKDAHGFGTLEGPFFHHTRRRFERLVITILFLDWKSRLSTCLFQQNMYFYEKYLQPD